MVIWLRTTCNLVDDYWHFGGTGCLQLQDTFVLLKAADFFKVLGNYPQNYTITQKTRLWIRFEPFTPVKVLNVFLLTCDTISLVRSYLLSRRWRWQVPLLVGKKELVCPFIHTFCSSWTNFYAAWSCRLRFPKQCEFVMMGFYENYETDILDSENTNWLSFCMES
jgi:hypothetical protein